MIPTHVLLAKTSHRVHAHLNSLVCPGRGSEDRELEEKHLGVFFFFFFCMICPLSLLVYFCDIFVAIVPEEYLALSMGLYGGREGGGEPYMALERVHHSELGDSAQRDYFKIQNNS